MLAQDFQFPINQTAGKNPNLNLFAMTIFLRILASRPTMTGNVLNVKML